MALVMGKWVNWRTKYRGEAMSKTEPLHRSSPRTVIQTHHQAVPDHWGWIGTFVAAARARSFSEAALHLGVSRSAVGKSIALLENRLGVTLFHRTTRKVSLTADGEAYYQACIAAVDEISSVEQTFAQGQLAPQGTLRIDMPVNFGRRCMLPLLSDMALNNPGLGLSLSFTDHEVDPIEEGIDLVVRFGELKDTSELVARLLTRQRRVICASPDYLARYGTPECLDDLSRHHCLVMLRRGQPLPWVVLRGTQEESWLPNYRHAMSEGEALVDAVALGLGICQFPKILLQEKLQAGQLVEVLQPWSQTQVDVHLVWPRAIQLRPKVRFVVDHLLALAAQGVFGSEQGPG